MQDQFEDHSCAEQVQDQCCAEQVQDQCCAKQVQDQGGKLNQDVVSHEQNDPGIHISVLEVALFFILQKGSNSFQKYS